MYLDANGWTKKNHAYAKMSLKVFWNRQARRWATKSKKYDSEHSQIEAYEDGKRISVYDAIRKCGGTPHKSLL